MRQQDYMRRSLKKQNDGAAHDQEEHRADEHCADEAPQTHEAPQNDDAPRLPRSPTPRHNNTKINYEAHPTS